MKPLSGLVFEIATIIFIRVKIGFLPFLHNFFCLWPLSNVLFLVTSLIWTDDTVKDHDALNEWMEWFWPQDKFTVRDLSDPKLDLGRFIKAWSLQHILSKVLYTKIPIGCNLILFKSILKIIFLCKLDLIMDSLGTLALGSILNRWVCIEFKFSLTHHTLGKNRP